MKLLIVFIVLSLCYKFNKSNYNKIRNYNNFNNTDVYLDSEQLIRKYKYPFEEHLVTTEDGYILNVPRIPRDGPPVLLVHGLGDSSDSWLVLGPQNSLAFLLADIGFDVWLFNSRGNKYSKKHIRPITKEKFWHFTFEEMGTRDLPAVIDHILDITQKEKISYIGFSQGCTIFFVLCSLRPEYNTKINHSILLAPVAWINNVRHPIINVVAQNLDKMTYLIDQYKLYEVFFNSSIRNRYHVEVCNQGSIFNFLCAFEYFTYFGLSNSSYISPDKFPILASHIPAGTSSFTLLHYIQNYLTKRFQRFDYGIKSYWRSNNKSLRKLPEYNLSRVTVPLALFVSASDWFTDAENVDKLKHTLTVVNYNLINESDHFSHLEFVYGARVKFFVNDKVIQSLLHYSHW